MRVGYINVQGLSNPNWEAACAWLGSQVDCLFLAETWFVDHERYLRDRRLVASTPRPTKDGWRPGRHHGGIYLLGTAQARAQIRGPCEITSYSISCRMGKERICGVYFPPSYSADHVATYLDRFTPPTVLLGDINTRFPHVPCQDGAPGPPDKVAVWRHWMHHARYTHLQPTPPPGRKPNESSVRLTVDHAWVQSTANEWARLTLVSKKTVGVQTDHRYAMIVTFQPKSVHPIRNGDTHRYRISRLEEEKYRVQVMAEVNTRILSNPTDFQTGDVDRMNQRLTKLLQNVCHLVLGIIPINQTSATHRTKNQEDRQTVIRSRELYKTAVALSKENDPITVSRRGEETGVSALQENFEVLKRRYMAPGGIHEIDKQTGKPHQKRAVPIRDQRGSDGPREHVEGFLATEVAQEITRQNGKKCCGADGIHIRLLKILTETAFLSILTRLFTECMRTGRTPMAWNQTEIHLLTKDLAKPRDVDNLRPITLICIFRKIFERLLLTRFDANGWAAMQPGQAGFRSHYSTSINAAIVHHLLATGLCTQALFVDFRSAFDVVNHEKLIGLLRGRRCPDYLLRLIETLMVSGVKSRILVNGEKSEWFVRTRGVLQGSVLSATLFNVYVDGLIERLNPFTGAIPRCLFYADDGVLLGKRGEDLQPVLNVVSEWSDEWDIEVNVQKCGQIAQDPPAVPVVWRGERIPVVEKYQYLGFPMTAQGIDFGQYLIYRITPAVQRTRFLAVYSDSWGPAHRCRVYTEFLAPMFEYGAPLIQAWVQERVENRKTFEEATIKPFKQLMAWIANDKGKRYRCVTNLCGMVSLPRRFQLLRTAYQWILEQMGRNHILWQVFDRKSDRQNKPSGFATQLVTDKEWSKFTTRGRFIPTVKIALRRFLNEKHREYLQKESAKTTLIQHIPEDVRCSHGFRLVDISLTGSPSQQDVLLRYRLGMLMYGVMCRCGKVEKFQKGHENCKTLPYPIRLTREERKTKMDHQKRLRFNAKYTDIDFLLNIGQRDRVYEALMVVQTDLRTFYHQNQMEKMELDNVLNL